MLHEKDIQTKEVLDWKGLHLFHFKGSTCSQKTRIFLRLKGIDWTSHHLNLIKKEHQTPWYMGINPRGLVPTLVHNGKVIIESNDIIEYLEAEFPTPVLIPKEKAFEIISMLKAEDDLHLDIRALTMRFVFPAFLTKRPEKQMKAYEGLGSGTVRGVIDSHKQDEVNFWRDMAKHGKITDQQSSEAFREFKAKLTELNTLLEHQDYMVGQSISVADIAWYIYARRLLTASYPLHSYHPSVGRWFDKLDSNPVFHEEIPSGGLLGLIPKILHTVQRIRGTTLENVASGMA